MVLKSTQNKMTKTSRYATRICQIVGAWNGYLTSNVTVELLTITTYTFFIRQLSQNFPNPKSQPSILIILNIILVVINSIVSFNK